MADTIGDIVDKLTIANIRLWNLEDARRDYTAGETTKTETEVKDLLSKISATNKERNSLIDQINAGLHVLLDKAVSRSSSFNITSEELLGTGKNKFYKQEDRK
jgi:hypothetical protein